MNIGSLFRIEGLLIAGAVGLYLQTADGVHWDVGALQDVDHLLQRFVAVEGIRTGVETITANWIEPAEPADELPTPDQM